SLLTSRFLQRYLHAFPTRRSSDLGRQQGLRPAPGGESGLMPEPTPLLEEIRSEAIRRVVEAASADGNPVVEMAEWTRALVAHMRDRKSTRLNSSHVKISYAVFCLK